MPSRDDVRYNDHLTKVVLSREEARRCYVCGRMATDVAHIVTRTAVVTRWDVHPEGNCHLLCRECHDDDHANPKASKYKAAFVRENGQDALDLLVRRSKVKAPFGYEMDVQRALKDMLQGQMACAEG